MVDYTHKMIHNLSINNSIINNYLSELRDIEVQKDPMRFRKNLERISEFIGFELSKSLSYDKKVTKTPLGVSESHTMQEELVIASILRAGLTMHNGLLNIFDRAENAFISAFREEKEGEELRVKVEYLASPNLNNKTLIIADPMLATGSSIELVLEALKRNGTPSKIHLAIAIASQKGIDNIVNKLPENTELWIGCIDPVLNDQSYIVPGLGDAGDLAFGKKL